jgi:hypothetical protein
MNFKQWILSEAAIGVKDILGPSGKPNFRINITENGRQITLELLTPKGFYKFAGDLLSEDFPFTGLKGYKLFNWHADLPQGYGPLFYDIAMEVATKNGGHLASSTFLNRLKNIKDAKNNKGHLGGDASDAADSIYKFYYYKRNDITKEQPNIVLPEEPDQANKPYLYEIYKKQITIIPQLININKNSQINNNKNYVLVSGHGGLPEPIMDMNF